VSSLSKSVGALTLFVEDHQRSKAFYERVFDAPVLYEDDVAAALQLENLVLNLLRAPAARELIEPAAVGNGDSGARFQLTLWVEDADASVAELRDRGVELLNGPLDRPWGMRTAAFSDPDGHVWEVAQNLSNGA
jgi:catechol 2,3-dioxygenase-like lactoylglutathione lyase family enzyme